MLKKYGSLKIIVPACLSCLPVVPLAGRPLAGREFIKPVSNGACPVVSMNNEGNRAMRQAALEEKHKIFVSVNF